MRRCYGLCLLIVFTMISDELINKLPPAALFPWHMATIDELPEDIYTEVKKPPIFLQGKNKRYQVRFTDKNKSKSLTDLKCQEYGSGKGKKQNDRKANTVEDIPNMISTESLTTYTDEDYERDLRSIYASQMEAMYADVALAYMKANLANQAQNSQLNGGLPPNIEEFLQRTYADMLANIHVQNLAQTQHQAYPNEEDTESLEEGEMFPMKGIEKRMYNASNSQTWPLANHLLEEKTPSFTSLGDPITDYTSASNPALSTGSTNPLILDDDTPGGTVYTTHIDVYNPYQVPMFEYSSNDPNVGPVYARINPTDEPIYASIGGLSQDPSDLENIYAHLGQAQASKHSTVRSYETIKSEHMLPLCQREGCQDVSL